MKGNFNQTFEHMKRAALEWLTDCDPHEIAENAGVDYDAESQRFFFPSLGTELTLTYPDYSITPQVGEWHYLLVLHYLYLADGAALTGEDISFSQMNAGMVRGSGIDRKIERVIHSMKDLDEEKLVVICESMGGKKVSSNADVTYQILFLPRFPVTLKVWLPDDEFPASGRLLLDSSADHYFTIEDAVTVAEILIERITDSTAQWSSAIK